MHPEIRYTPGVNLSSVELTLLTQVFIDSEEVLVERELHAGFSGTRVLLVRPGNRQAHVVVKLGSLVDLYLEWEIYRTLVEKVSPQNTARIQGEPVSSDDGQLALLCYTFVGGDPRHPTSSLRTYFQEEGGIAAAEVLKRVFHTYGRQWWSNNTRRTFVLDEVYDRLLPVHLKLKASNNDLTGTSLVLVAGKVNAAALRDLPPGQHVRLLDFRVSEVRFQQNDMTLTTSPPPGEASANLRLRVEGIDPAAYHPGDQVAALGAIVTATRHDLLSTAVQAALPGLDVTAAEVKLAEITCLNPLHDYVSLLDHVTDARFSIIHGDLNLDNILVDSDTGFAWLIDFADTCQGPALFDLQRLEAQVITKLLSPAADQAGLGPAAMIKLYQALHAELPDATTPYSPLQKSYTLLLAIRRLARQFLINDLEWDEYYRGLILTLLGTLKFAELSPLARAMAFAGASAARSLINIPLPATIPHSNHTHAWRWFMVTLVSLVLLMVTAGVGWLWWRPSPIQTSVPLAIVANMTGKVEIRRHNDDRIQPAAFGLNLFMEDAVLTYEQAAAFVLCNNGLLLKVDAEQVLVVHCQETGDNQTLGRLDPRLSTQLIQTSEGISITLAPADTRASRADIGQVPILVEPRNTAITETRPTWRWADVPGVKGYLLIIVNAITGERWQIETTATELTYPDNAPPLTHDTTYLTQLSLVGTNERPDESFFFILNEADQKDVITAVKAIQALPVDPVTKSFLSARTYQYWQLWGAAITQLEAIPGASARPELKQQLGDLYFQVGLYSKAEINYQAALTSVQSANNQTIQAEALVGLGRVADVYGEVETAINHFQAAETLYQTIGDMARAEAVTEVLAKLATGPEIVSPHPTPTP